MNRRQTLIWMVIPALLPGLAMAADESERGLKAAPRPRTRRPTVRVRVRRMALRREVSGRDVWLVPVGTRAGWELVMERDIVTVRAIRGAHVNGQGVERATVVTAAGDVKTVDVMRQDLPENAEVLAGSVLDPADQTTPSIEISTRGS